MSYSNYNALRFSGRELAKWINMHHDCPWTVNKEFQCIYERPEDI